MIRPFIEVPSFTKKWKALGLTDDNLTEDEIPLTLKENMPASTFYVADTDIKLINDQEVNNKLFPELNAKKMLHH